MMSRLTSQACPECLVQQPWHKVSAVLYCVMQAAESRHTAAVESLKEGWVGELKRQKEAWAAAEKTRRDTWLADKTKQVKELTVKVRGNIRRVPCACCMVCLSQMSFPVVLPSLWQWSLAGTHPDLYCC